VAAAACRTVYGHVSCDGVGGFGAGFGAFGVAIAEKIGERFSELAVFGRFAGAGSRSITSIRRVHLLVLHGERGRRAALVTLPAFVAMESGAFLSGNAMNL